MNIWHNKEALLLTKIISSFISLIHTNTNHYKKRRRDPYIPFEKGPLHSNSNLFVFQLIYHFGRDVKIHQLGIAKMVFKYLIIIINATVWSIVLQGLY